MGETLKERLDRLSEAATDGEWRKAHSHAAYVRADSGLTINGCGYFAADARSNAAFCMALVNYYRSGDLIPRDAITPAMAAEVLLGDIPNPIFDRLKYPLSGEFKVTCAIRDEDGDELDMDVTVDWPTIKDIIRAALIAIKESKDD